MELAAANYEFRLALAARQRSLSVRDADGKTHMPGLCVDVRKYADYFPKIDPNANKYMKNLPPEMVKTSWTNTIIDQHGFIHSPTLCRGDEFILWIILSGVDAQRERQAIRDSWGGVKLLNGKRFALTFILGTAVKPELQTMVDTEAGKYGDMIQGDFHDSYRNMTYKTIMALRWAVNYCSGAQYVVRATDDVLINLHKLITVLQPYNAKRIYYGCPNTEYLLIYREGKFKYISEVEWTAEKWPPFQDGFFSLMSGDVIRDMYLLSCKIPMTWPDDVYVGALAIMLNLPLLGYQDHCVGIGHKPYWNVSTETLAKVVDPDTPVTFAHFGGNPVLPEMDVQGLIVQYWKTIEETYAKL